jgi:hypothetical protein
MAMTVSNNPQDGSFQAEIALPDSGTSVAVAGAINPSTPGEVDFTGSPVTIPSPPGSGLIYYIIEASTTTGALQVKQSTSAFPTADAGNIIIYEDIVAPSNTDPALDPNLVTPDT